MTLPVTNTQVLSDKGPCAPGEVAFVYLLGIVWTKVSNVAANLEGLALKVIRFSWWR